MPLNSSIMKKQSKKVPLGPPLNTNESDMDLLALVTPEDIALAQADAASRMTPRGQALIDAARDADAAERDDL